MSFDGFIAPQRLEQGSAIVPVALFGLCRTVA